MTGGTERISDQSNAWIWGKKARGKAADERFDLISMGIRFEVEE